MTPDTQPTAFGDLTQPPHVPTGVSTGDGVTVPTPAPTPRTMEQIAQECAEKVCHEGCLLDRGVACELIATAIAQAVEQKDCKIANQAERIRYLEGATNHATGTPLSKAKAERDALRAEVEHIKAWANAKADEAQDLRATLLAREGELDAMSAALAAKDETIAGLRGLDCQNESIIAAKDREIARLKSDGAASAFVDMAIRAEKAEAELAEAKTYQQNNYEGLKAAWAERDQLRAEVEVLRFDRISLIAANTKHRADLAAAQLDKERLDWLAEQIGPGYAGGIVMVANLIPTHGGSLRAAIDTARSPLPESGRDTP